MIKFLNWVNIHVPDIMLMLVYLFSATPFFMKSHGMDYYVIICGTFGFVAYFTMEKTGNKNKLITYLVAGILIIGITALFFIEGIKSWETLKIHQQSLSCYWGGLLGIFFAGILESIRENII